MHRQPASRRRLVAVAVLVLVAPVAACGLMEETQQAAPTPTTKRHKPDRPGTASEPPTATVTVTKSPSPSSSPLSAGPMSWSEVFAETADGVVRLDVLRCDGTGGSGTGFLVDDSLVATVAHVVDGYRTVRVTSPQTGLVTDGTVVGFDKSHDLALVETVSPLQGHLFELDNEQPPLGTEIGIVGFPLGRSMQITTGTVSATHDHRTVEGGYVLSDMLLTDAVINGGNSGGPWLTADGRVVALSESGPPFDRDERAQGNNAGVAAEDAANHIEQWRNSPEPLAACGAPPTPEESALLTLHYYFRLINQSDYASAYAQLDSSNHPITEIQSFIDGVKTSQDSAPGADPSTGPLFETMEVTSEDGAVMAEVRFQSRQDADFGPEGLTCADWHLRYDFVSAAGVQAIHDSSPLEGEPRFQPCDGG